MHTDIANPTTTRYPDTRIDWLLALSETRESRQIASLIVRLARSEPNCEAAAVLHGSDDMRQLQEGAAVELDGAELALVRQARALEQVQLSPDGTRVAKPLFTPDPAILFLRMRGAYVGPAFLESEGKALRVAGRRLATMLELTGLRSSVAALERAELLQRSLFAIADLAGSDCAMPELLKGIHAIVDSLMYAENFFIVRADRESDQMHFLYFVDVADPAPPGADSLSGRAGSLTWYVLTDGKALRGDSEQLAAQASGPLNLVGSDSYMWMGVPMVRNGIVEGAIVVQSYEPGIVYSADDQAVLEFVGSHILTALERKINMDDLERSVHQRTLELADANRGLQQEVVERQRAERLQAALFHIAELAASEYSQTEFYPRVQAEVGELINAENFFIGLLSEDRTTLEFPYAVDASGEKFLARPLRRGLSEYVMRTGRAIVRAADFSELVERGEIDSYVGHPAVCWMGVPLVVDEKVIGLVAVQSYDPAVTYGPADAELLGFVASQIASTVHRRNAAQVLHQAYAQLEQRVQERTLELRVEIAERERIQGQLKHEVMHDALTGLPNRGYLLDRLGRVLRTLKRNPKRRCALLYLDVDRFKIINDSLGHLAGDEVLKEVARRLQVCVRDPDIVARLSGDEFAILLEDVEIPGTAVKVANRVLEKLGAPLHVAGKELEPSVSIGIAIGDSRYVSADDVLRDADVALYRAKHLGRKRFELFDEKMQRSAIDVLAMEGELRTALQLDQFEPYFQPIMRLETGAVVGYEALIRWNHPTRGVLNPADFLHVAQESGSIEAIDWRMFELSCASLAQMRPSDCYLTINVAPMHFRRQDFDERLLALLDKVGLPYPRLVTEVTEGSLLDNPDRVSELLQRLCNAGVCAALDDFGTGYSSLSYLHKFPFRILKIDRSFVHDLGSENHTTSATVVSAVLALAHALKMEVIAEGIETAVQRDSLVAMRCEFGQGYLLGRPAPLAHWTG